MTKTLHQITEILITRYEQALAVAEKKGMSVWEKKAELRKLKADFAVHVKAEVAPKKVEKKKEIVDDPFKDADHVIPSPIRQYSDEDMGSNDAPGG